MLLRHTPKEIKERTALTVNPAKTCQPIGAMYAALGIHSCLPHSHGSQGCYAYHRSTLTRHYKEPVMAATSAFTEGASVWFPVFHKGAYFYLGDGHATPRRSAASSPPALLTVCPVWATATGCGSGGVPPLEPPPHAARTRADATAMWRVNGRWVMCFSSQSELGCAPGTR